MQFSFNSAIEGVRRAGSQRASLFMTVGMTVLLIIVAVLQYRWTTQLNQATEVRIGSTLQSSMMAWNLDFYGELSAICIALQVGPDSGARDNWNNYLHRYRDWSNGSVENFYANPG